MVKKKSTTKKLSSVTEDNAGLFVPGGLLIGMGIGFLVGNIAAWLFIGLGAGLIGMFFAKVILQQKI